MQNEGQTTIGPLDFRGGGITGDAEVLVEVLVPEL